MHDPRFGELSHAILGACIEVHRQLGPGLLESAYEECLVSELGERGLPFERQPHVRLVYKGRLVNQTFRPDFIVRGSVVLEVKSVETIRSVHKAQLRTYLKLCHVPVGLLVNFNVPLLREGGIRRFMLPSKA
ncbi:MAG: GxxExxY protein [Sandaracinaceae bacterium]